MIAINKEFPGPVVNVTTNYNVAVNVLNSLDEPLLITWYAHSPLPTLLSYASRVITVMGSV